MMLYPFTLWCSFTFFRHEFFFYNSWSTKITITVKKNKNSSTSSWAVLNRCGSDISGCYPLPRLIWQIVLQSVPKRSRQRYEGLEIEQSEWKQQTWCKEATAAVCFMNSMCHCMSWDTWRGAANNHKIILKTHHLLPPGRNRHHGQFLWRNNCCQSRCVFSFYWLIFTAALLMPHEVCETGERVQATLTAMDGPRPLPHGKNIYRRGMAHCGKRRRATR